MLQGFTSELSDVIKVEWSNADRQFASFLGTGSVAIPTFSGLQG